MRAYLPEVIRRYKRRFPQVDIRINEELNHSLLDTLIAGGLDLAIVTRPEAPLPDDIVLPPLISAAMRIVACRHHPLAGREVVALPDLLAYDWILPPHPDPDRFRLEELLADAGIERPRAALETTSADFQMSLLPNSPWLSYMSRASVHEQNRLVVLNAPGSGWWRHIGVICRRRGLLRPTAAAFMQELEKVARF